MRCIELEVVAVCMLSVQVIGIMRRISTSVQGDLGEMKFFKIIIALINRCIGYSSEILRNLSRNNCYSYNIIIIKIYVCTQKQKKNFRMPAVIVQITPTPQKSNFRFFLPFFLFTYLHIRVYIM